MKAIPCPCGSKKQYVSCCGRYLDNNEIPATAEALMRSRYTAYTLLREDYLLTTWHISTRPVALHLTNDAQSKWISLVVKHHVQQDAEHAIVEFVARYKVGGRAHRIHEVSRFERECRRWFYVGGDVN